MLIGDRTGIGEHVGVLREARQVLEGKAGGPLLGAAGDEGGDLAQLAVPASAVTGSGHVRSVRDAADLALICP